MNGKILFAFLGLMMLVGSALAYIPEFFPDVIQLEEYLCCGDPFNRPAPWYICYSFCEDLCYQCGDKSDWGYDCIGRYGYGYFGYGYPDYCDGDQDDSEKDKPLDVDVESDCDGNIVKVTSKSNPVNMVKVTVWVEPNGGPLTSGYTNSTGELAFSGCDMEVKVYANRVGYESETIYATLIDCDECEEDGEPEPEPEPQPEPEPETPPTAPPTAPSPECTRDDQCSDTYYCTTAGECMPVPGCGNVTGHMLVEQWECGDEEGCPECRDGYTCVDHECVENEVEGEDGFVGDLAEITILIGGRPCADCDVQISGPEGDFTGKTDSFGKLKFNYTSQGTYKVVLIDEDGVEQAAGSFNALPKPSPTEPEKPSEAGQEDPTIWFLLFLVGLIVVVILFRNKFGKGKK